MVHAPPPSHPQAATALEDVARLTTPDLQAPTSPWLGVIFVLQVKPDTPSGKLWPSDVVAVSGTVTVPPAVTEDDDGVSW